MAILLLIVGGCSTTGPIGSAGEVAKPGKPEATDKEALTAERARYVQWLRGQGEKALAAGNYADAYTLFAKIIKLEPGNPHAFLGLAESSLAAENAKEAAAMFTRAAKSPELEAKAFQGMGLSLAMRGHSAAAEKQLRAAIEKDPTLWRAWNGLGELHDYAANWDEARKSYQRALEIKPDAAEVHNNLGVSYLMQRKYTEAERVFRMALERDPTLDQARSNLRLALGWQGKYAEAMAGTDMRETPVVLNNLGYIAIKRGDFEYAEAYLVQAMQLNPAYYAKAAQNLDFLKQIRRTKQASKNSTSKGVAQK